VGGSDGRKEAEEKEEVAADGSGTRSKEAPMK